MSYNGIGLSTSRGSGTNGYIQKNYTRSTESGYKRRQQNKESNEKRDKLASQVIRDQDLVKHDDKRKIENLVSELRDKLEDEDELSDGEIEKRCLDYKKSLMKPQHIIDSYKTREDREKADEKKTKKGTEQDY